MHYSGEPIEVDVLCGLEELTRDKSANDSQTLSVLSDNPADSFPHFQGEWGDNQTFVPYIGATWKSLLLRSPDDLDGFFKDGAELVKYAERLIKWGTTFEAMGFDVNMCDFEKSPGLPLDDDWEDGTDEYMYGSLEDYLHDYEPEMPPAGHAKDGRFFYKLGLFGSAACRAYELSKLWEKEPTQKRSGRLMVTV